MPNDKSRRYLTSVASCAVGTVLSSLDRERLPFSVTGSIVNGIANTMESLLNEIC